MSTLQTLAALFLIGLMACNSANKKNAQNAALNPITKTQSDTEHLPKTGELYNKTPQQIAEERKQDLIDSLNMVNTLSLALKMADKQKNKNSYTLQSDSLTIRYGYIFSSSVKHLMVRRKFSYGISVDIYKFQNNSFVKVCSKEMAPSTYINDTIQDVNGDGRADYLYHWYPMSGCCMRDIYDVFLQKPNGDFIAGIEFINPNFSAKEKTVRGLCYGYNTPLYKYRWNRYKIDTIEYIYLPNSKNGNHFIKRKHNDENEKGVIIKELPAEYKKIGYGDN